MVRFKSIETRTRLGKRLQHDSSHAEAHASKTNGDSEQRALGHDTDSTAALLVLNDADHASDGTETDAGRTSSGQLSRE